MKKLLSLLSVLTISGTVVPTTIAASPYQKQETINSDINYQQTNNLKNLIRNKREKIDWHANEWVGKKCKQNPPSNLDLKKNGSAIEVQCRVGNHDYIFVKLNLDYAWYIICATYLVENKEDFIRDIKNLLKQSIAVNSTCVFGSISEDDYEVFPLILWNNRNAREEFENVYHANSKKNGTRIVVKTDRSSNFISITAD